MFGKEDQKQPATACLRQVAGLFTRRVRQGGVACLVWLCVVFRECKTDTTAACDGMELE